MKTYIERFNEMVDEIRSHSLLTVVEFNINPPATQENFNVVEQRIEASLADLSATSMEKRTV